jgi:cytoskeletal protein RodZ
MDEELVESDVPTVGEQLKAAREEKKLSLEDIAAQTRIPQRHLESIENGEWDKLPAPTYTIGFAKSYASSVGLDRTEIGDQLREEMGGQRFATSQAEVFEAADPARTMPRWLVIGAVLAVILLVVVMSWLNRRSLQPDEAAAPPPTTASTPAPAPQQATAPAVPAAAQGPVTLTATAPSWIQVKDQGKTLFEGQLAPGQSYSVPQTAVAPVLRAGAPETLKVTVGAATAPPVGPAGKVADNVSILGPDLMRGPAAPPPPAAPAPAPVSPAPANPAG